MTYLATARPGRRPGSSTHSSRPPWTNKKTATVAALCCALTLGACSTSSDSNDPYETNPNPTTNADSRDSATAPGDGDDDPGDGDDDTDGETLDLGEDPIECDVWTQDCPDGEKCTWEIVDTLAKPACVPVVDGAKAPGDPCTMFGDPGSGHDDCELGAICSWLGDDNQGVCLALCSGSANEPSCESAGTPAICQPCIDCPSLCVPTCDPLLQDCDRGYACIPNAGEFTCTPAANVGDGGFGAACEYSLQCQAGFACIEGQLIPGCDGVGCCSPFCDLEMPVCPQDLTCQPWFEGGLEPPALPFLGVCEGG